MVAVENTQCFVEADGPRSVVSGRLPAGVDGLTVVFSGPLPGTGTTRSVVRAQVFGRVWIARTPGSFAHATHRAAGRTVTRHLDS
ncbi:hypothetical protein [Streptomyces spiramyceticus]|uniref:hypothetical protein n=1 Tax=Streptomyces spiramyceticus TaxID=299717 RepID=UPI00237BCAE0|nr:hypothetical protein [Streptomyces spiramyceticus]